MKNKLGWGILFAVAFSSLLSAQEVRPVPQKTPDAAQAFEMSQLLERQAKSGRPWLPFLRVPTLHMGVYVLAAGDTDHQGPHDQDEVYYVVKGQGTLQVDGKDHAVKEGSIVYVKAKADHRFSSITEDLQVLVFFSTAPPVKAPRPRSSIK